jgi:sRNA-binding carbon storage regulator CsrA
MLVCRRRPKNAGVGEDAVTVIVDGKVLEVTVLSVERGLYGGYKVALGFTAPMDFKILRNELLREGDLPCQTEPCPTKSA